MCSSVQILSLEIDKNNIFWESYHNSLLEHKIWVKPMTFKRNDIELLEDEISNSKGPKLHSYLNWKVNQQGIFQIRVLKGMLF